ncbi:hypothetical protein, partial [uncultured Robinsoniella sp.]
SCEMHQDFGANTRVPPKSASGRLENASSALSIPNTSSDPPPSLSVHNQLIQSVFEQQNPNICTSPGWQIYFRNLQFLLHLRNL